MDLYEFSSAHLAAQCCQHLAVPVAAASASGRILSNSWKSTSCPTIEDNGIDKETCKALDSNQ